MSPIVFAGVVLGLALSACSVPGAKFTPLGDDNTGDNVPGDADASSDGEAQHDAPVDAAIGPDITAVEQPPRIATGDTVTIKVSLHSIRTGPVAWTLAATKGAFTPTSGSADIDANGKGTFTVSFKASATAGDDAWTVDLDDGVLAHDAFTAKVADLVPIGDATSFADHAGQTVTGNVLYGQKVTLAAAAYLMRLGLFSDNAGTNARMALYLDNGAAPASLVAQVAAQAVVAGRNEIRLASPVQLNAGTYWLMADFDGGTQVRRNATNVAQIFVNVAATAPLPATTAGSTSLNGLTLNYFAEVIP